MRPFLFWSGLITSMLLLDDFFLVHDALIPRYLGLSEKLIFLSYGMVTAWYLLRFRVAVTLAYSLRRWIQTARHRELEHLSDSNVRARGGAG
jgi:hypothetical protein